MVGYTGPVVRTISINPAFPIKDRDTLVVRIASKAWWTFTVGPVIVHCAFSS